MTVLSQFRKNLFKSGYIYSITIMLFVLSGRNVNLWAQDENIVFERFNTSHGLSNNIVISILQDIKGYLWIGTNDGLNKYDGYNFISYRNDPLDSTSISSNNIITLFEDRTGNLWIGTQDGLNLYDDESERFENDTLTALGLGSCVGCIIYDTEKKIASLAHIMLPDSSENRKQPPEKTLQWV